MSAPNENPFAMAVTLTYDEWMTLLTLCADVQDGHGTDAGVRAAAGAGWGLISRRGGAAAGVAADPADQHDGLLRQLRDRPRPWAANRPAPTRFGPTG